ncbi:MAG: DNA mismatch repair endonuclease MutL, partial [Methanoregula sp.]
TRPLDTIARLFGPDYSRELIPVSADLPFMKISGYISRPALTRKDKDRVLVSINNRFISSLPIISAVREGYGTLLFRDRYPVAFLSLEIDTRLVDVNVHPTKKEVRLSREKEICDGVREAVRKALHVHDLIPDAVMARKEQELPLEGEHSGGSTAPESSHQSRDGSPSLPDKKARIASVQESSEPGFVYDHEISYSTEGIRPEDSRTRSPQAPCPRSLYARDASGNEAFLKDSPKLSLWEKTGIAEPTHAGTRSTDHRLRQTELATGVSPATSAVPELAVIGQVGGIYILAEGPDSELFIIDQHAAHERIFYEKICLSAAARHIQELIEPGLIHRSPKDAALLRDLIPVLAQEGVIIEDFGSDSFLVRAVPAIMGKIEGPGMIDDLVSDLLNPDPARPVTDRERITRIIACRSAIKAGTVCTQEQCQRLIDQLRMTKSPFTCPHGRPTIIRFPRVKLDEMFKRI